jgi:hypothetical protein
MFFDIGGRKRGNMPVVSIEISDKALEIMTITAEIQKISLNQLLVEQLRYYEKLATGEQKNLDYHYEQERKLQRKREARAYYKKNTHHAYVVHRKGKENIEVSWWDCPMIDRGESYEDKEVIANYGQYALKIQKGELLNTAGFGMNFITKTDYEFYPTLKRLKKAVNRWFKHYGHQPYYKV